MTKKTITESEMLDIIRKSAEQMGFAKLAKAARVTIPTVHNAVAKRIGAGLKLPRFFGYKAVRMYEKKK